ncbi:MAG: hypothetical protein JJE52_17985, partial [Acidimicrobiia bacterium]|nr:hypothetical protein [Acidimicrobiia bacterium]
MDQRPEWIAEERSVADIVEVALRSVRDADRQLLELRYLAGWTNDELAAHLGIGSGTVRKRVHDARQRLRPHLEHLNPKEATMADLTSYLDLVHDAGVVIPDAPPLHAPDGAAPTPTGLKIIDTAAPVVRGGTIEMVGPAGAGQVVVALELLYRIGRTEAGTACVAIGAAGTAIGSQPDLGHIVTEPGIPGPNAAFLTRDPKDASKALLAGSRLARGLAVTGIDVVVVVDSPTLREVGAAAAVGLAGLSEGGGSVTVVAIWGP